MGTYTLQATKSAILRYRNQTANDHTSTTFSPQDDNDWCLVGFEPTGSARFEVINSVEVNIYNQRMKHGSATVYIANADFDEKSVTYLTFGGAGSHSWEREMVFGGRDTLGSIVRPWMLTTNDIPATWENTFAANIVRFGIALQAEVADNSEWDGYPIIPLKNANRPYLTLKTSGVIPTTQCSLRGGGKTSENVINRLLPCKISWSIYTEDGDRTAVPIQQTSAIIKWHSESSSTEHTISVSGNTASTTVPANTFPAEKVYISGTVTLNTGATVALTEKSYYTGIIPELNDEFASGGNPTFGQTLIIYGMSPSNNSNILKSNDTTFRWEVNNGIQSRMLNGKLTQTSAIFKWRDKGSTTEHTTSLSGETSVVTVPAGTFKSDEIEWAVVASLNTGETITTEWLTVTTTEPKPATKIISPKDTIVDGSTGAPFAWEYIITSGTPQYAFELQKSTDGTEWTTLVAKTVSTETNTVVPAASLTGGDMYWRVRVYNNDDVASEWSDSAKVLVVAAPAAPGIVITSTAPRFAIRWSSADQQGYEIAVDGVTVLSRYGTASTYTYDDWLTDGSHTVAVRVQNKYSLWSEWSTIGLPILNTPGAAIYISSNAKSEAPQFRIRSSGYDYYVIYRNSKRIAQIEPSFLTTFTDNFANGENTYMVRGGYNADGNYGESDETIILANYKTLSLYDTTTRKRLSLGNAKRQTRETNLTISRNATLTHYSGAQLPTAETGQQRDRRYQFECAFSAMSESGKAQKLEAMLGHIVCVCDQYGTALVGIASSARVTLSQFMYSYTVSVDEVDFDEVGANA